MGTHHGRSKIIFYKDSTYFYAYGTKKSSLVALGTTVINRDTIRCTPFGYKKFEAVMSVAASKVPGDSVYIKIFDKNGIDITGIAEAGLWVGQENTLYDCRISPARQSVHNRPGGRVYLKCVEDFLKVDTNLSTAVNNNFAITLNVCAEFFYYTQPAWNGVPAAFVFKNNRLKDYYTGERFKKARHK